MTTDETPPCKTHPNAPHGFDRNASHNADRYVCECESWEPDEESKEQYLIISQHVKKALMGEPKKQWVGLTDKDKDELVESLPDFYSVEDVIAAVAAKLKEKNA